MKLNQDRVAEGDLVGGNEDVAGGVGGDGVAAFEDAERAALLELQEETLEAFALRAKKTLGADSEVSSAFFKAQAEGGDPHAKIK